MTTVDGDRRSDILNSLNIRVSVLEAEHLDLVRVRLKHELHIEKLTLQDTEMLAALNSISAKFDGLISQFTIGFRVIVACSVLVTTIIGAFWTYSHSLDMKYAPKIDLVSKQVDQVEADVNASKDHIAQQKAVVRDLDDEVSIIQKKKVLRASK